MDKGKLVGGVICLAVAALLTVLNLRLPADEIMFTVGDRNMPWVPVIGLAVVGILLLATMRRAPRAPRPAPVIDEDKAELNKRMEMVAWGCFLIMLGGFLLVPKDVIPKGVWSIGVGVIMLGLNAARYSRGIKMSGFTTLLGALSLVGGTAQLMGLEAIEGPFLLIILGTFLLVKPWVDRRRLFGKAEEA